MPSFFSRLKHKDAVPAKLSKKRGAPPDLHHALPTQPAWTDAWARKTVEPEEVQELLQACTLELKARALDIPFFLLPFRPMVNTTTAARTFIRNFFDKRPPWRFEKLVQELRLTEPMVIVNVVKWCWSRLEGGVVTWEAYELFKVGETDSKMARDAFATFIPLSIDSDARIKIIFDFFDLLSAIAAHGLKNGLGGRKVSRLAGWWAFDHKDSGNGFEGGYKSWVAAADATSHLFFAYLRSLAQDPAKQLSGISTLPMSLQKLTQETEYPPERPVLLQTTTDQVVMMVDSVSPTPFSLLRRANHFQYRDSDRVLKTFSEYDDPVEALTEECQRVLQLIASVNESQLKKEPAAKEAAWSRFEDMGFTSAFTDDDNDSILSAKSAGPGLRTTASSRPTDLGRPTTPSWADFLSSGFNEFSDQATATPMLLPPDKILPPIETMRGRSSHSHNPRLEHNDLDPGELASISKVELDDAFWWVWITSLSSEETAERKASFGRCALVETVIKGGRWIVLEEMVKGAVSEPQDGAYIAEKKTRFGWTRRSKGLTRRQSTTTKTLSPDPRMMTSTSKTSIGPDQHARIQAAAIQLQRRQRQEELEQANGQRRGRADMEAASQKTNSVFTLQPVIMKEASSAMKWANKYDKDAIRAAYLADTDAGRGGKDAPPVPPQAVARDEDSSAPPVPPAKTPEAPPPPAKDETDAEEPVASAVPRKELPQPTAPIAVPPREPQPEEPRSDHSESRSASRAGRRSASTEPESPESPRPNKLHKEKPQGGFRKVFGRSKIRPRPADNGQSGSVGRRLSTMRKTPANAPQAPISPLAETQPEPEPVAETHAEPSPDPAPVASVAEVTEAPNFTQGPLEDVPAFVPDSPVSDSAPAAEDASSDPAPPEAPREVKTAPVLDRWAQIRKNAEERNAQRPSDDHPRRAGPPSDIVVEESIESRVARIKARVAELTGNMDTSALPSNR